MQKLAIYSLVNLILSYFFVSCELRAQEASGNLWPKVDIAAIDSSDCDCRDEIKINNEHHLEGYTDKISYKPGAIVKLYAHSLSKLKKVELVHHENADTILKTIKRVCSRKQDYTSCSFKNGCNWSPNLNLRLPLHAASGYYSLKLSTQQHTYYCSFIIQPEDTSHHEILVVASTNTWQAYNSWGGGGFYKFTNYNPCALKLAELVSFHRPNNAVTPINSYHSHLMNAELLVTRWLGIRYDYDVISDDELAEDSSVLSRYKLVILNTHSEYWTSTMYKNMEDYLNQGGNLICLAANSMYWKVTKQDFQMECRKLQGTHQQDGEIGGRWRELGKPESAVLGSQFDRKGMHTYSFYTVLQPSHWVFDGTNMSAGQQFGQQSLSGDKNGSGASGTETDRVTSLSPSNVIILAHGNNPSVKDSTDFGAGGADMTYYNHPGGGAVFSAGSISYGGSLLVDKVSSKITENVIQHFLHK